MPSISHSDSVKFQGIYYFSQAAGLAHVCFGSGFDMPTIIRNSTLGLLLVVVTPPATTFAESPRYSSHADLSFYCEADGTHKPIHTPADWDRRREHIRLGLQEAMGPLPRPEKPVALDTKILEERQEKNFIRRKLAYHTDDPIKVVKAWLFLPLPSARAPEQGNSATSQKHPAMLCLHQTVPQGKDSPAGLADRPTLHYARELAERGYVTLAPDYPSLGEYEYNFDADNYVSGSMKAIYDNMRAIDLLQSLPEVDGDRIGSIGHSLGGHNSLFTAVFDERIKVVVTSCGFTSAHKYYGGDLHGWSGPRYMPLVATKYNFSPDKIPFDFPEILAAIAPRAIFVVAPLHDANFEVSGVRDCIAAAKPIFTLFGQSDHLQVRYPDCEHDFPNAERRESYEFIDRILRNR